MLVTLQYAEDILVEVIVLKDREYCDDTHSLLLFSVTVSVVEMVVLL